MRVYVFIYAHVLDCCILGSTDLSEKRKKMKRERGWKKEKKLYEPT